MKKTTYIMNKDDTKILTLQHVGLHYSKRQSFLKNSRFWALRDVSFNLYLGETLGIIGRNGVGKSTLLRVLAGIISPDKGQMLIHKPGLRISLISLQAGFVPFLSGRENAILSGILLGATKKEILSHMDNILAFSELNSFLDQPVNTYSTGMRARLGFSVAYYVNPDVILLDEILGVGDEAFRQKSTAAMKQRIKSDKTVVLVSHSVPLVREVCDRLVWIENGKTKAQGEVSEVLDAYLKCIGKK
jgi:lipopolysaccharide transport system ATP-binding protein